MKFKAEFINILDDDGEVIGFLDAKTPRLLFVSKGVEYDIIELETIVDRMKELQYGSST